MSSSGLLCLSSSSSHSASELRSFKTLILFCNNSDVSRRKPGRLSFTSKNLRFRVLCSAGENSSASHPTGENSSSNFCIIEGPETVQEFVEPRLKDIQDNIKSRRNKIFLLMEEVRRLRVQERIKNTKFADECSEGGANEMPEMPSSIPFFSHVVVL